MSTLTIQAAEAFLAANLAPWIQDMDIAIDAIGRDGEIGRAHV